VRLDARWMGCHAFTFTTLTANGESA
jgi:hypothetical protein